METTILVGIAGGSGAGKTTLARLLAQKLVPRASVVCLDAYYRSVSARDPSELDRINWDHPSAIDFAALAEDLDRLRKGMPIPMRDYDYSSHRVIHTGRQINPSEIIIVEGALLFVQAKVREKFDLRVFVHAGESDRRARRVARDIAERQQRDEEVVRQFVETVAPMHDRYVAPSAVHADLILAGDEEMEVMALQVLRRLSSLGLPC